MKHVETISALIKTLLESDSFHALVIQSPPGWAKSTTIHTVLSTLKRPFVLHGAYSTPLHLYNTLCAHPRSIHVLDDCAGIFGDVRAMSLLKAATWSNTAPGKKVGAGRRIAWGSTSDKVASSDALFRGKLILLSNVLPAGQETQAFLSRSLSYRIRFSETQIREHLLAAARSMEHFDNPKLAKQVVEFLLSDAVGTDLKQANLRTLQMGYALAKSNPEGWKELFLDVLPHREQRDLLSQLAASGLPIGAQEWRFRSLTGKSRRTFFDHRKKLGLTRPYGTRANSRSRSHILA